MCLAKPDRIFVELGGVRSDPITMEATMADISVRRQKGDRPGALARAEERSEPLRVIRDLLGWDPFREMVPFVGQGPGSFMPSFEVKETGEAYIFKADLPGVKESDLDITVTGNRLTVCGKREDEEEERSDRYYAYERSYGEFSRSFTLPPGVDMESIDADLKEGVLTLKIKKAAEAQPRKVSVGGGARSGEAREAHEAQPHTSAERSQEQQKEKKKAA